MAMQTVQAAPQRVFNKFPAEERADRLREQTDAGHPESDTTCGPVAYRDGEPVGWCAVEPRSHYEGLRRNNRVPWQGRDEDKADESVWAVTCFFIRRGYRKSGVSRALARGAVDFARGPRRPGDRGLSDHHEERDHRGTPGWHSVVFADAGLSVVSRPTLRRVVMRLDF